MIRGLETFITERDTAAKDSSPLAANILDNSPINQSLLIAAKMKSFVAHYYRNGIFNHFLPLPTDTYNQYKTKRK